MTQRATFAAPISNTSRYLSPARHVLRYRNAFLIAACCSGQLLRSQSPPMPVASRPGTVLEFLAASGSTIRDSVLRSGPDSVFIVRSVTNSRGAVTASQRTYIRTPQGIVLRDNAGQQLVVPSTWPPTDDWESVYSGTRYRYTFLRFVQLTTPAGRYDAAQLQLILGSTGGSSVFDIWLIPNVGFGKARSRPNGGINDYELTLVREPPSPTIIASC